MRKRATDCGAWRFSRAEAVAGCGGGEVLEVDPVAVAVGELGVVFAGAGEVGVEVEAEADVGDDEEGGVAFLDREVAGVALGLAFGFEHGLQPALGAADRGAAVGFRCAEEECLGGGFVGGLFGFLGGRFG